MRHTVKTTSYSGNTTAVHFRRIMAFVIFFACVLSSAVLSAGPASAASRGFTLTNESTATLRLEGVSHIHHTLCGQFGCVSNVPYPLEFEGRPHSGSEINPGETQRWELKYGFSINLNEVQYAARLTYKIEHTNAKVEYTIETTPTSNNSTCEVIPASAGQCTATGLALTFRNN
jgi:hypothetical protein